MTDITANSSMAEGAPIQPASRPNLDKGFNPLTMILFFGILAAGVLFVSYSIYADVDATGTKVTSGPLARRVRTMARSFLQNRRSTRATVMGFVFQVSPET